MTPRLAPGRSWAKANNPFWSNHVAAWYRSALEAEQYCRKHDLSTTSLMRWARHLLSKEDLRKRAEHLRNLPRKTPKGQHKKRQLKPRTRPPRYRYSVRTDTGPIALQAFWGMHVEAMNFSGMGHAEYAAALGLSPHSLRISRDRLEQSGNEMDWQSLLHPSARAQLSSAANCARGKYRLTPQEGDGRSNRRHFTDEQKRAMVQETEKPGVAVAEVCRRHGIATSLLFRWRALLSVVSSACSHPFSLPFSSATRPSDAGQDAMLVEGSESRCAVQSSALGDGLIWLH